MKKLRELRKAKKMTQEELAEVINVSSRSIGYYESGDRDPKTEVIIELANFFDVTVDFLVGVSDENIKGIESPKKLKDFMYAVMKEARRFSLMEVLNNWGVSEKEYDEIAKWFNERFGIKL